MRVGMVGGRMGGTMWTHVKCFMSRCVRLEYAPNARAKCRSTGEKFRKGELRAVIEVSGTKGCHKLTAAALLVKPVFDLDIYKDQPQEQLLKSIPGFSEIDSNDESLALRVLMGKDSSSLIVKSNLGKKRKRRQEEVESDDENIEILGAASVEESVAQRTAQAYQKGLVVDVGLDSDSDDEPITSAFGITEELKTKIECQSHSSTEQGKGSDVIEID